MKVYKIGNHEITLAKNSKEWTKLTKQKPAKIEIDDEGFTIDWS